MPRVLVCLLLAFVVFAPGQEQSSNAIPLRILVLNSAEEAARVRAELETGVDFDVLAHEKNRVRSPIGRGLPICPLLMVVIA